MIAKRRRLGTTSRNSSSRLVAVSCNRFDRPVRLLAGRGKLATSPVPTGSPTDAKTIGMTAVALLCCNNGCGSMRENDVDFEPDKLSRDLGEALVAALRPANLDRDGATLDPSEFAQPLYKSGDPLALDQRRGRTQEPNGWQLRRLLRPRREWPRGRRATEQRDEIG